MPPEPSDLDRSAVRRQFDRRADGPDAADFLPREVERRMFERLELVKLQPARILDVGCGLGDGVRRLRGGDPSAPMAVGFELVYGHAWIGERKRRDDGWSPVEFRPPAGGRARRP
ncbi:MAG: hypothetical protein ACK53H_11120 [Betaproteobacteria bacterium]